MTQPDDAEVEQVAKKLWRVVMPKKTGTIDLALKYAAPSEHLEMRALARWHLAEREKDRAELEKYKAVVEAFEFYKNYLDADHPVLAKSYFNDACQALRALDEKVGAGDE